LLSDGTRLIRFGWVAIFYSVSHQSIGSIINTDVGKLIKGDDVLEKIGDTPVTKNNRGEPEASRQSA